MRKLISGVLAAAFLAGSVLVCSAAKREDVDLYSWSIKGVYVTPTAAELNIMDGVTATADELNQATNLSAAGMSAAKLTAGTTASAINGTSITNLDAANITAGSVASAINGASITNLGAANITAAGTLPQLNGAALTALDGANIASGDIPAARMTAYAALTTEVYGESTFTGDAGAAAQLFMTNVIQTVAGDGSTPITDYAVIRVWVSETDKGTASTNNIEALTLSTGTAVETKTADADYIYLTGSAGEATVVIEGTASSLTNYLMISVGPQVNSKAIIFVAP